MELLKSCFVFLVPILAYCEAAKILAYYPYPSISHQIVFQPITMELIKRGHHLTVITPDPLFKKGESPANLREINVHDASYSLIKKRYPTAVGGKRSDLINQTRVATSLPWILVEEQFKNHEVKDLLRLEEDEFDLLLLEAYPAPAVGLTYKFRCPTILVGSLPAFPGNYETLGAPTYWPVYHDIFRQRLYNLSMLEKIKEFFNRYRIQRIIDASEYDHNRVLKGIFGRDIPPLSVLRNNIDMLFVNVHPIWEGNHPVPPGVIHIGGVHLKPPKPLPKDLQDYLDSSKNGVIYFSFGSNVKPSLLPQEKLAIFEKVLSQVPYDVLWKWDSENVTINADNIKMFQWLPQADLLRHPKVKLFICQGGLQSTDEAITAGVPLIGIPMFGDQWYNSEKYVHHKIGLMLDLEDLTEDGLRRAVVEVVKNKSYRDNVERLRSLMQDEPQTPLERSIWWIEYVLRHKGAKHLRAPTANMSWSEFLELELVGVITIVTLFTIFLITVVIRFLISSAKKLFRKKNKAKKT